MSKSDDTVSQLVDVYCSNCGELLFKCKAFLGSAAYCGEGCAIAHTGRPIGEIVKAKSQVRNGKES